MKDGAPGEIRTPDPLVRSQMLYPAELRARDNILARTPLHSDAVCMAKLARPRECEIASPWYRERFFHCLLLTAVTNS